MPQPSSEASTLFDDEGERRQQNGTDGGDISSSSSSCQQTMPGGDLAAECVGSRQATNGAGGDGSDDKKKRPPVVFREKHFTTEAPLLDQYFDLNGGKHVVLFNFFVAVFVLVTMAAWAQDFQRHANPFHHFWLIAWNFHQLPQTLLVWMAMFGTSVGFAFGTLRAWQCLAAPAARWPHALITLAYICYQLALFYYSIRAVFWLNLQGACSFIITCENTRIAMKIHSFFRENVSAAAQHHVTDDTHGDTNAPSVAAQNDDKVTTKTVVEQQRQHSTTLEQFIYFMFCPTFIYRNAYPTNPTRSWHKVGRHLVACLASMYFVSLCFSQWIIPHFSALAYPEDLRVHLLVATIFPAIIPGAIALFIGIFYGILHSWLSMFAEALRFGDRRFYSNWWNSRNMAEYYRNWNLVVHDWLYAYIYRDISMLLGKQWGPAVSQCLVFFLSAFFHEYWFAVSLRMFYPAIFTLYFIFGGIFFLISRMIKRKYIWNTLMWWNLLIGTGIFVVCYTTEWYARQRCAQVYQDAFIDMIMPRSWACRRIS